TRSGCRPRLRRAVDRGTVRCDDFASLGQAVRRGAFVRESRGGNVRIPLHSRFHASPRRLPWPPLVVDILERLLATPTAMRLRMTGAGCNGISSSALVQRLLSICGRELDLKFMDLVPLGVGSPALRYGEKLLQASAGGHRLRCVHDGIIPSFDKYGPDNSRPHWPSPWPLLTLP